MRGTGQRRGRGGVRGQRRRACLLSAFRGQRRQLVLGNANPAGNRELTRAVGNPDACRLPITNLPRGSQIFAKPTFLQLTSSKRVGMACHPRCIRAPAAWHRAEDYRHVLHDVAGSCIYSVDRNPMAVELTKVDLWIETVEPGKTPRLPRCQHTLRRLATRRLRSGSPAPLRRGIPDATYKPLTGDDKVIARDFETYNKAQRQGQISASP